MCTGRTRRLRALMQFPRDSNERLMFAPSRKRNPLFFVLLARSEPAKSIRDSFAVLQSEALCF
ncbi:hypothetical protein MHBO_004985 [Bonamia ostreae]|uniref:Uncharacterized protein n=1 Tax=Bonamia ostreae TaxID=126728 RepID=A0ABV2AUS3_9EUKA